MAAIQTFVFRFREGGDGNGKKPQQASSHNILSTVKKQFMMAEDELKEYQTQLAEVEGLLLTSPDDPSLLSLKSDLLELIATVNGGISPPPPPDEEAESSGSKLPAVTETSLQESSEIGVVSGWSKVAAEAATNGDTSDHDVQQQHQWQREDDSTTDLIETAADRLDPISAASTETATATTSTAAAPSKKSKPKRKIDDNNMDESSVFQVPRHLVIDPETDSQAEQNRKRRAIKTLKNQWRGQKKEVEARSKQKSWQSFQKKQKKGSHTGDSMFSTNDNKVGIVSGRNMTDFKGPQRNK